MASLWEFVRPILVLGITAIAFMLFQLWRGQEGILYHPTVPQVPFKTVAETPSPYASPSDWGLPHEEVALVTSDGVRLHAWFLPAPLGVDTTSAPTVVYFHANALHLGFRLQLAKAIHDELQANLVLLSYRGYGNSEGTPSEAGLKLDAEAVLAWVASCPDIHPKKVFLFGQSLGGAVAIHAASVGAHASLVAGVVVENTFTSIEGMVDHLMPWVAPFKALLLRMHWSSVEDIARIRAPILFVSGLKDELVPPFMMQQLHDRATGAAEREVLVVPDGGHNDTQIKAGAEYWARFRAFIERTLRRRLGAEGVAVNPPPRAQAEGKARLLEAGMKAEATRQAALLAAGRVARFDGVATATAAAQLPATAGPGMPLDILGPADRRAEVAAEGAAELLRTAAEDDRAIGRAGREKEL